ncbi:MAG: hypothetical protein IMF09_11625 [Proteobacteria bacterium]|nr:hypothetical protein [Pseudomonadota bacterium]
MGQVKTFKLLMVAGLISLLSLPVHAGLIGSNQCLADAGGATGCTAKDIGVQSITITKIIDSCTSTSDTATVQINMAIASAQATRYDIGMHIATDGGDAIASGNTCVHEALFPVKAQGIVTTQAEKDSGVGPYFNSDGDACGEASNSNIYQRIIVDSDIPAASTTPMNIVIACSDIDGDGFVDISWAATWQQNAGNVCSSLTDVFAGGPSKCQTGTTDSDEGGNPIPISVSNLGLTISCTPDGGNADPDGDPSTIAIGEVLHCTVVYTNTGNGAADHIEFHGAFPDTKATLSNLQITLGDLGDTQTTTAVDYNWQVGTLGTNNEPLLGNIPAGATATATFDLTSTYDGLTTNEPISVTAYFNNGIDTPTATTVFASTVVTLPVSVAYVEPQVEGNSLNLSFTTASETMNAGFNVYAVNGNRWRKINRKLIPGAIDSLDTLDYNVDLKLPKNGKYTQLGIGGVDVNGVETRSGPFPLDQSSGSRPNLAPIDWTRVREEIKVSKRLNKLNAVAPVSTIESSRRPSFKNAVVDINVTEPGVYEVSHDQLVAAGINLKGIHTSKIALSLHGKPVRRHLNGLNQNWRWTENSSIQFIGSGPTGTDALYLNFNKYQLSFNKELVMRKANSFEADTRQTLRFEENNAYALNIPGNDPFYESWFYAKGSQAPGKFERAFELPSGMPQFGTAEFTAYLGALSEGSHHVVVSLNGKQVAEVNAHGWRDLPIRFDVPLTQLQAGDYTLSFVAYGEGNNLDVFTFDKVEVKFIDESAAESKQATISLHTEVNRKDLEALRKTDLLVISHPLFMAAPLDRYIAQRESDGWRVKLVNVEDIYSAYGYGMATPNVIKEYLAVAAESGVSHVQLVGAATYDYRNFLGKGAVSFIGSIYTHTGEVSHYTPCDACMVMDENDVPQMAIGRWPVRTLEGLDAVVTKTLDWEASTQASAKTALFISDKEDTLTRTNFSRHMQTVSGLFSDNGWSDFDTVSLDDYIIGANGDVSAAVAKAREDIMDSLNSGVSIVSYDGHSSPTTWSFEGLLKMDDIVNIQNEGSPHIALPLACYTTYADGVSVNSMAHQMMAAGNNGAVAMFGAATLSDIGANSASASGVITQLLAGKTLGEAVLNTKVSLGKSYDDIIKNSNLLGDVTLRLEKN